MRRPDLHPALASKLKAQVLWGMDEPILLTAGRLKAEHRVSLADALIAAFALRAGAALVHKDPEYDALAGVYADLGFDDAVDDQVLHVQRV